MKPTDEEIRVAIYATKTQHRGICHDMADELLALRALIPEVIEELERNLTEVQTVRAMWSAKAVETLLAAIIARLREAGRVSPERRVQPPWLYPDEPRYPWATDGEASQ